MPMIYKIYTSVHQMTNLKLKALLSISKIDLRKDLKQILNEILNHVGDAMGAHSGSIMLLNEETGELEMVATFGLPDDYIEMVYSKGVPITTSPSGVVLKTGRYYLVPNVFEEPRVKPWTDLARELGFSAQIFMPMKQKDEIIGLLNIYMANPHEFTETEIVFLTVAASQAAAVIENARLYAKIFQKNRELEREINERKQAERGKGKAQAEAAAVLDGMIDVVGCSDMDGRIIRINEGVEAWGYKKEELIGKPVTEFIAKRSLPKLIKERERTREEGVIRDLELIGLKRDGSEFPVLINVTLMKDTEGKPTGRIFAVRDITERKRAEGVLRNAEEDWCDSFNSLEDVMLIIDRDYNIENINEIGLKLLGKSKEEVIGRKCYQVLSGADSPVAECPGKKSLETKKVESFDRYEERFGKYFSIKSSPIFDENGEIIKFVDLRRDITKQKRAEKALEAQKDELEKRTKEFAKERDYTRHLIESSPDFQMTLDKDGRIMGVNEAFEKMVGKSRGELIGSSIYKYLPKEETEKAIAEIFGKGKVRNIELTVDVPGKGIFISNFSGTVYTTPEGKTEIYATGRDITEQRWAEDMIKASLKEKEILLREIHHRVKNNLQIISSLLNMQAMKAKDKNVIDSLLDSRSRIQMMSLIHSQLYQSENLEQVAMDITIHKLVNFLFKIYAEAKKNIWSVVTTDGIILDISQAIPCGLIINELVSNALKHAFKDMAKGIVEISMYALADDRIKLTVKDNGVGLPEEFDIYKTDTLGLKIVRTLAEDQLKGKMGITRNNGTEFYIEFDKSITNDKLRMKNYELGSEKK
jgi:PAS domain S-box-containing protein